MNTAALGNRKILLIISGGIAAYKCLELIRLLKDSGASVVPILTSSAEHFVAPVAVSALAECKARRELFDLDDESKMGHIELSRAADLIVVAPASADLLAKMAGGHADDLASTVLLATDKRVLVAPAMNVRMWHHPSVQRNVDLLESDGAKLVGPNSGVMACGEFGTGRMAEPSEILTAIKSELAGRQLAGKRIIVTSGTTHEAIDPVRFIANRSSGKQGTAIANALLSNGAEVMFVTGPTATSLPQGANILKVESARDMLAAVKQCLPADAAIFAAAVADWRVASASENKVKKSGDTTPPALAFVENPDILATVAQLSHGRPRLVVGFAAETEDLVANAEKKRARKGCDWIVANSVAQGTGTFGGAENEVTLVTENGTESWPRMSKDEVARRLVERVAGSLSAAC